MKGTPLECRIAAHATRRAAGRCGRGCLGFRQSQLVVHIGARLVAASGYNEFGRFVSVGSLEGGVLCLARRYLEKRDERCVMRAQQVLNVAAASGAVGGEAPWRSAAKMMGAALQPRKRARGGASEQPATAGSGGNEVKGRGRPPKSADGRRQRERGEGGTYK